MRLRIDPLPTPQEAEAIAAAIEVLLARSGHARYEVDRSTTLRFNDDALSRKGSPDTRHAALNASDSYRRDYTWRGLARIEALTPGV